MSSRILNDCNVMLHLIDVDGFSFDGDSCLWDMSIYFHRGPAVHFAILNSLLPYETPSLVFSTWSKKKMEIEEEKKRKYTEKNWLKLLIHIFFRVYLLVYMFWDSDLFAFRFFDSVCSDVSFPSLLFSF